MTTGEQRRNWFYFGDLKGQIEAADPSEWSGEVVYDAEKKRVEDSISFLLEDRFIELTRTVPAEDESVLAEDEAMLSDARKARFNGSVVLAACTGETVKLEPKLARELYQTAQKRINRAQLERARKVMTELQTTLPVEETRLKWDVMASPYGSGWEKYSAERFEEEGVEIGEGRVLFDDSGAHGFVSRLNDCIVVARKEVSGEASLDVFALVANRVYTETLQGRSAVSVVEAIEKLAANGD